MVSEGSLNTELSPLDQIRQVEADVIRQIAAAREAADLKVNEARSQVKVVLNEARESGRHRGQTRYDEILTIAEEEAHAIISQAHEQADRLHNKGEQRIRLAVNQAMNLVLCRGEGGETQ